MLYTRQVQNLGTPEEAYLMGSNEKGGVQRGGNYIEMTVDNSIPVGPRGGLMHHTMHQNHNINSSTNMGTSIQHNYQTGGMNNVCHDIKKVESFYQVQSFWQSICPGAVMIYQNHLQKLQIENPKLVKKVVVNYTKAFCHEVSGLKCKTTKQVDSYIKKMKNSLNEVKILLNKLDKKALGTHKMIVDRHVENLKLHKKRIVEKNKRTKKMKKVRKSLKNKYNKIIKKTKKAMKSRKQKGGYNQYLANVPYGASYEGVAGPLNANESALANFHIKPNNVHGIDNYNHYEGKGSETGVYDKAPKM
jgi:hypothetical protein